MLVLVLFFISFLLLASKSGRSSTEATWTAAITNSSNSSKPRDPSTCLLYMGRTERNYKVLVFINEKYMDFFHNWYMFFSDACQGDTSHLEVICMDNSSEALLGQFSPLHCSPYSFDLVDKDQTNATDSEFFKQNLGAIWIKRMDIIQKFLRQGVDLVLSDTDALWVKDPLKDLSKYTKSDVVASRGWFPWHLQEKWGSCLCMGFAYFKATKFSIDLVQAVSAMMIEHRDISLLDKNSKLKPDDQFSMNQQLDDWNISWDGVEGGKKDVALLRNKTTDGKKRFVSVWEKHYSIELFNNKANNGLVVRQGHASGNGKVTLLPHTKFLRSCHNQSWPWLKKGKRIKLQISNRVSKAIIVHCRFADPGDTFSKADFLYSYELWRAPMAAEVVQDILKRDKEREKQVEVIKARRKVERERAARRSKKLLEHFKNRNKFKSL